MIEHGSEIREACVALDVKKAYIGQFDDAWSDRR